MSKNADTPAMACIKTEYAAPYQGAQARQVDVNYPGLTKREYAAIHAKVPRSGDPEIDAIIREGRRWDAVIAMAQAELITTMDEKNAKAFVSGALKAGQTDPERMAHNGRYWADALLAELGKGGGE